jgi:hypothetical protein
MERFKAIRTAIKELSAHQILLKRQRKESYKGERCSGDWRWNKDELRHLFQAYAILKGKERPEIKREHKYVSETKVQELVNKYREVES